MGRPDGFCRESSVEAVAAAASDEYYRKRCAKGGMSYPKRMLRDISTWKTFCRVARACIDEGIDARRFVSAAYDEAYSVKPYVTAAEISRRDPRFTVTGCSCGGRDPEDADKSAGSAPSAAGEEYARKKWDFFRNRLMEMSFGSGNDSQKILEDPNSGLPSWFRVFFPTEASPSLVSMYGGLACEEVSDDTGLMGFLRSIGAGDRMDELMKGNRDGKPL